MASCQQNRLRILTVAKQKAPFVSKSQAVELAALGQSSPVTTNEASSAKQLCKIPRMVLLAGCPIPVAYSFGEEKK